MELIHHKMGLQCLSHRHGNHASFYFNLQAGHDEMSKLKHNEHFVVYLSGGADTWRPTLAAHDDTYI
ncbi:hypothetical protein BgiBS90_029326, partial [Biomphalaria glabrata]